MNTYLASKIFNIKLTREGYDTFHCNLVDMLLLDILYNSYEFLWLKFVY